jgi:hypothetical protein
MIASPRRRCIVYLDATLLVIFVLLLSPRMTGLALHEILGLIFFIPIIIHLLIAWPWIQNTTRKFFKTANRRTRLNFVLNTILFILVINELVSGCIISQVVLPKLGIHTINDWSWRSAHNLPLNFVLLFTGLHIAINWGWILAAVKKRSTGPTQSNEFITYRFMSILIRTIILCIASCLVYLLLFCFIGAPSVARLYHQNEMARFNPNLGHGLTQLFGEILLLAMVVFIARKWLRVRL